ncbi:putative sulfotransferase [Hibiscus syriacus]|uniref:Sulfotransferase n=1 Tax=Hibiscus syriacus TaxID=106335 RepID=A0A6A2Z2N8_HIBSY|nr:putative sulfotransferase [Hibiscus syriacus]
MTEHLVHYQGFWLTPRTALKGLLWIQDHFKPRPTDIFVATSPKTDTTWLKALIFATVNRTRYGFSEHTLLTTGPHDCFPFLDIFVDGNHRSLQDLDGDPKDVLVSKWLFMNKLRPKQLPPFSLEEAFGLFCQGISHYGPYWDHVLGYWKASLETPEKILFLKYEDLKMEPFAVVKRLGEFTGYPFSLEEESEGVVEEMLKLCSFENLSDLEVNKTSVLKFSRDIMVDNRHFFRKGEVGDGKNYLTEDMIQRLNAITADKLHGSGLVLGN